MKAKKIIIYLFVIAGLIAIVAFRLVSNKKSFEENLKMISEFNITVPVIVDTVKYEKISNEITVNGTFKPNHEVSLLSETQGNIISLNVKEGDKVSQGQILASVDYELAKSQSELAKFNLEKAEKDMQRFEQLSKGEAISAQQYESARQVLINAQAAYTAAKIQYDHSFIKAPFNGILTKKYIDKGSLLMPGVPVFDIIEISKVLLSAKLTANETEKIKKGQFVKVIADDYPGYFYHGVVSTIVLKEDLSKRYELEIEIQNNTEKPIKPGMFGKALFSSDLSGDKILIPRKALPGSIKKPEVYVVKGDLVSLKNLEVTVIDDKVLWVQKGLSAGDVIVVSGQINLVDGTKIKIIK